MAGICSSSLLYYWLRGYEYCENGARFFKSEGKWVGRGVKEKQVLLADKSVEGTKHLNDKIMDTVMVSPDGDELHEVLGANPDTSTPKVVNEVGENDVGIGPAISTPNPGKLSSYANVTSKPSRTKVNFRTLFSPTGNGINVVVPVESIRTIIERSANTAYGFFLGKRVAYPVVANYIRNTWVNMVWFDQCLAYLQGYSLFNLAPWMGWMQCLKMVPVWVKLYGVPVMAFSEDGLSVIATKLAMIELRADVELKDNIVVAMPKITGEGYSACVGETKNLKKPSQTPQGVPVGQKVGFKPTKQVFQPVSKKPTANTNENKKKNMEPTKEVSISNPFDVLTLVENDVELGTNGGTLNLASQEANSSGSSFWNVDSNSPSTTPIIEKIDKIKKLIIDGKVTLVDDEGKPLEKVFSSGDYDSEDEVASVDHEMASFFAKKDRYGTQSLLEQWKESYENGDFEYDPYDDDMYEGQELPDKLQAICDNLDIKVMGRNKK
ncbi:hypothetical protein Tco_1523227 [Tanacetum coccineum]